MSVQITAKEQFDRQAKQYDAQWSQWSEESLDWLLRQADLLGDERLLDVATGTGFTALAFAPRVRHATGLDVSAGMLAEAQRRAEAQGIMNVTFLEGVAESLPFPSSHFDRVTCRIAPHHFASVPMFLAESWRVLKRGGALLLADTCAPDNDPEAEAWQHRVEALRDRSHVRNYRPSEWRNMAEGAGFLVAEIDTLDAAIAITLEDWLKKAGCEGEAANQVRSEMRNAPFAAQERYGIKTLPEGDIQFCWSRVALKAIKS